MPLPQLTVHLHDRRNRAPITMAGEIDLESAPLVRTAPEQCLHDGIHVNSGEPSGRADWTRWPG
ncbi:hypothetical protein [Streptomyces sp. NPDC060065]|uniref:hypothetical protein n=1 Tax=Streptomyces sp. NPDC060065 TaxID=3347050 RepID=UPI0036BF7D82